MCIEKHLSRRFVVFNASGDRRVEFQLVGREPSQHDLGRTQIDTAERADLTTTLIGTVVRRGKASRESRRAERTHLAREIQLVYVSVLPLGNARDAHEQRVRNERRVEGALEFHLVEAAI